MLGIKRRVLSQGVAIGLGVEETLTYQGLPIYFDTWPDSGGAHFPCRFTPEQLAPLPGAYWEHPANPGVPVRCVVVNAAP